MVTYVVKRLLLAIPVLVGVSILIFALVRLAPGDPVEMMMNPEQAMTGGDAYLEARRAELGLDRPLPFQYLAWVQEALRGDLGFSYVNRRPVTELIGERIGPTVRLMVAALLVAVVVGLVVGVIAAVRQNTWVDYVASIFAVSAISVPSFFLGLAAIYVFALVLGVLPPSGMQPRGGGASLLDQLRYLLMPALILGLSIAGPLVRYVRAGMLDVLSQDYLRTANAKGISSRRILTRHALRNALIPLITVVTIMIPVLFAGAVVVENVFSWPGMGSLMLNAISSRDYPVLVGFTLVVALLVVLCNLLADVLYAVVDPRIRYT
ncbi:ABC transporter permease [Jiangella gansuensis]|uniref:ABC transporter permease n=1 Tax=Jiangella gansuensis TaxID=281473 RepID=UPI00047933C3|nr:ABC transporter permease [Jiangella gansuensis]